MNDSQNCNKCNKKMKKLIIHFPFLDTLLIYSVMHIGFLYKILLQFVTRVLMFRTTMIYGVTKL